MTPTRPQLDDVEAAVWAFEAAATAGGAPDLTAFLPPPSSPHFLSVLRELACVELERAATAGERRTAADYLARFPVLAADPEAVAALARQEARAAETSRVADARRPDAPDWRAKVAGLHAGYLNMTSAELADRFGSLDAADAVLESGLPVGPAVPKPGDEFLGFRIVRELGSGAFGRVFLAEQTELAARPVALKVGERLFDESRALAQLQHSNIVPIYSAHRSCRLQALCMPYLGATTLADVINELRRGAGTGNAVWSTLAGRAASTVPIGTENAPEPRAPQSPVQAAPVALDALRRLSHARAVLWVGAQLADGLAHAHERGVLHRDIKPANVLVADDGTPLLLDFNLSADLRVRGTVPSVLGGTLPYMAPEHLEAFRGGPRPVDERSDIYALGVVLFELLTGRHPFGLHSGPLREQGPKMIADRNAGAPRASALARDSSPAFDAILARCLHPDPAHRYQTARGLHEDLQRQFDDRPLVHTREPSLRERGRKFVRRNPRGVAFAAVTSLSLALAATGTLYVAQANRTARAEAVGGFAAFRDEARDVEVLLGLGAPDDAAEGERLCRAALARYGLPARADWDRVPAFTNLPPDEQRDVRETAPRLVLLMARAVRIRAVHTPDPPHRSALIEEALALNARAAELGGGDFRRATLQRALLLKIAGRDDEAKRLLAEGQAIPPSDGRDRWLEAGERVARGDFAEANQVLEELARTDPSNAALWATRGACATALGRHADAVACYSTVLALRPQFWRALVWRAEACLELNDPARARADLDAALARSPDHVPALFFRGLARFHLEDFAGAEADLSRAIELGATNTRVCFVRARVRLARKDEAGAAADRVEGLRLAPSDEFSWVARGVHRQAADPTGALADFEEALKLNPHSRDAAQNKAATLSEFLGKPREAVAVLAALVERLPDFVEARIGRAVLLARLGRRADAHADAVAALKLDRTGPTVYRAGCVYALTAKTHPADRDEAFRFVTAALLGGYGGEFVATDDDLAALHADRAEFARLLKLAGPADKK